MKKYGFIGLGDQGGPIAMRMIEAGLPTVLWARRPEALQPYENTPAETARDIPDLARQVSYVGICVVDDQGVRQVCDQLMTHLQPGSCIAIHSTVHPDLCRELAQQARSADIRLIDAPVSGGGAAAAAGKLTVMVGGDEPSVALARPVLDTFASVVIHLGDVGAGQNAKLINNAMLTANIAIAHHGLTAAAELGIDRDAFIEIVRVSSGHSFGFNVAARMETPRSFSHGAPLLRKDVRLLGETLGDTDAFRVIRDASNSFLKLALPED